MLASAVGLIFCAGKLNLDLWHDEVFTVETFVSRGAGVIVTDYSVPNNHVLYSLLLRPFYLVSDSNFMLRLPSLAFSAGTLALVFLAGLKFGGPSAAVPATLLLALNQMFLVHTMQIRGYGLSMFLCAWLVWLALRAGMGAGWRRGAAIVAAGAAFLYTLPTNLLFLAPAAALAMGLTWHRSQRDYKAAGREALPWTLAGLVAGLLYLPIVQQVWATGSPGERLSWLGAWTTYRGFLAAALHDAWPLAALAAIPLGWWAWAAARRRAAAGACLLGCAAAMVGGSFVLTALLGVRPFERNYCPLLPPMALAGGWLLGQMSERLRARLAPHWPAAAGILAAMIVIGGLLLPQVLAYPRRLAEQRQERFAQDGYYNYYAADYHPSQAAAYLADNVLEAGPYYIAYADEDHLNLWYYLKRAMVPPYRGLGRQPRGALATVYAIVPPIADYDAVAARCGLSAGTVRRFSLVKDFGYYRLLQSKGAVRVRIGGVHRPAPKG